MSAALALNERPQGDNQTVALFCVIRLKGDLGQSRHLMEREACKGSQICLLTWRLDVVSMDHWQI